jgi:hypothetical protein
MQSASIERFKRPFNPILNRDRRSLLPHRRFEATFTNVINRSNFAPPQTNISNRSTFGALTAVLPQGSGGNRTGQMALRLDF